MKPETAAYLTKARSSLADATKIAGLPLPHDMTAFLGNAYQFKAAADYMVGEAATPISTEDAAAALAAADAFLKTIVETLEQT